MALVFKQNWNVARQQYVNKFGNYQAFLDILSENNIRAAFNNARNSFSDRWVREFIDIANNPQRREIVTVMQGSHQPENMRRGGFCLHFTGKDSYGFGFHFYIMQDQNGNPYLFEITYREGGQTISDFR